MLFRSYPIQSHDDPKSKAFVPSELDEYKQKTVNESYNSVITRLKNDLAFQRKVNQIIETLERPYLNGIPGVHKNLHPEGVKDVNPPEGLGFQNLKEEEYPELDVISRNQDRWLNQTVYYPKYEKMTHYDVLWPKEVESRPVTRDFHPDKGYKYDVPVSQKWPHVADRMGYPEILGDPFERLMRLEGDIFHPVNLDQPFVDMPTAEPHPSLNFEEGEVIYENTQMQEWAKFFTLTGFSLFAFLGAFVPYSLFYKTHMFMSSAMDNIFLGYHNFSMYYFDNLGLHIPIFGGAAMYLLYAGHNILHAMLRDYVVKMQYSKDKELIFVTRLSPFGGAEEEVYETAHLECLPPSVKAGIKHLSMQDSDGIWDITDMNSQEVMALYNEDKFWNPKLKQEFIQKTLGLWRDVAAEPITHEEMIERQKEDAAIASSEVKTKQIQ